MIYGTISGQNIKIADTVTAAETNNTLTAKFTFSKEWDRLKKIAYFRKSGEESFPFVLENDCIPARAGLNLSEGEWEISIRGYDLRNGSETENTAPRLTTNIAMLHVWETVSPGENEFPEVPKTFAEQILATAEDAKKTAADVERRANAGEFNGKDGVDGKDGADGKNGADGKDGKNGKDGKVPDDIILVDGTPTENTHMLVDTDGEVIEVLTAEDIAGLYTKPGSGIPESDLSVDVQYKLNSGGGGGTEVTEQTVADWGFTKFDGDYNSLSNKPNIPDVVTSATVRDWGFAYQSEIPDTAPLEDNLDKLQNAVFSAPVYPANGGTQYEILTGYFNPGGTINYQTKWARTLYLTNGIRDGNMLLISCPSNWLMRFTLVNYRTSTDMDVIETIPYQTESGAAIVRVPSGANRLGVSFKRASGDTSTDVTEEELAEISEGFKISEVPAPVTDQHIIDVITAAFPNAEGVGF